MDGSPRRISIPVLVVTFASLAAIGVASLTLLLLPSPAEVVMASQRRAATVRTMYTETSVSYRGTLKYKDERNVSRTREEAADGRLVGHIDRGAADAPPATSMRFLASAGAAAFSGEYIFVDARRYLRFTRLPESFGPLHFEDIAGKWLVVDVPALFRASGVPFVGGGASLTKDAAAQLAVQAAHTPFFTSVEKLSDGDVGGVKTRRFRVRPEMLYVKDLYFTSESARLGRELTDEERGRAEDFFSNVTAEDGEVWIGKGDTLPYHVALRFRYEKGDRAGIVSIEMNFAEFNRPVTIAAPPAGDIADATPYARSLLPSFGGAPLPLAGEGSIGGSGTVAPAPGGLPVSVPVQEGDDDPDKDGLSNALERFYGADPRNPDSDGDGASDGEEVSQGKNPTGPGRLFDFFGARSGG